MISQEQARDLMGATLYDTSGGKIGKIGQVFLDDDTSVPEFATVHTGLFGGRESFVPLAQAEFAGGDEVRVPYDKDMIKGAPNIDAEGHLTQDEEQQLYSYYGLGYGEARSDSGLAQGGQAGMAAETTTAGAAGTQGYGDAGRTAGYGDVEGTAGRDVSGPTTDEAMTRSEQRLNVGTQSVEAGRARLRKYVTTENVTQTVPVTREQVRVEREPITEANRGQALSGPELSEEEHEVVLHEERPVVEKETVPVERVRLGKEAVTGEQQVTEEVAKEQIETEGVYPDETTTAAAEERTRNL